MSQVEAPEQELLVEEDKPKTTKASFGVAFALLFCFGFGLALVYAAGTNWTKECDAPLRDFLMAFGVTGVVAALVFLGLEMSTAPDDPALTGLLSAAFYVVLVMFAASGITGSVFYWGSSTCSTLAVVAHRWTFAGVLAFVVLCALMACALASKFGAPFFAIFGFVFAKLLQFLADLFRGLADTLNDDGDENNKPPKRSSSGEFALYVNHAAMLWLFGYVLLQVHDERNNDCDKALHACLVSFSVYGIVMTYCDFLFEKFAGVLTRQKLKPHFRIVWGVNILAYIIWGAYTSDAVFGSKTCKETSKGVYRLSFLLACVFLVVCGLLALALVAGALDFLCSGRLRFVVVVETGEEKKEEEKA